MIASFHLQSDTYVGQPNFRECKFCSLYSACLITMHSVLQPQCI